MIKRIWALTGELKIKVNGVISNVNVTLYPEPNNNGFIVVIQLPNSWWSYHIDTINDLSAAIRQAIVDIRRLNGNNDDVNVEIVNANIGNLYIGYKNMIRDKVISSLDPLNDIYVNVE